jgi:DNA-binding response OmpR family regulator
LPRTDGLDALQEIKASKDRRGIPVVIIATSEAEEDVAQACDLYANDYLVKPVDSGKLAQLAVVLGFYWLGWNRHPWSWWIIRHRADKPTLDGNLEAAMEGQAVHILLVEDEEAHAELVRRAFGEPPDAGRVRLTVAGSITEAEACLANSPPDLVIADWLLPDGRGTDLLPIDGGERAWPLVLMTAFGDERVAVEAMKAGALDYVVKSSETLADMPHIAKRALREWQLITERKRADLEREVLVHELTLALAKVRILSGLLPICGWCKKIRDDEGYWTEVEVYISEHSDAGFTHGICPECAKKQFPAISRRTE